METRAQFGYTAPIGTTDDGRFHAADRPPPAGVRAAPLRRRAQGASDQQMRDIVAEGLQEVYFKDGGRRAENLEVSLNNIDYFDVSF